jgi:hypothetical protein
MVASLKPEDPSRGDKADERVTRRSYRTLLALRNPYPHPHRRSGSPVLRLNSHGARPKNSRMHRTTRKQNSPVDPCVIQQWLSKLDRYRTFWIDPDERSVGEFEELMAGK